MATFPSVDEQMSILMRGVDFGDELTYKNMERELRARLEQSVQSGKPLKVYCGFDPSSPDLHLGHTIPIRKLRQFQELGHEVTFLIGTFTGLIGDPSDKESVRKQQTLADALEKATTYADQVYRILDRKQTAVRYNHEWLGELSFSDVIGLAGNFTVQQFLARDNFSKRFANNDAIWLHEFFYALMQGYDAVALETDVQIGGTDQLFNLMAGRKLMEAHAMQPQIILTFPILVGTDGVLRMSKSTGNYIGIDESPGVIFTKVLNVPDSAMRNYAELVTRWPQAKIDDLFAQVDSGAIDMRSLKQELAWEIVSIFHGDDAANQAADDARRMHEGEAPSDTPTFTLSAPMSVVDILSEANLVKSKGEARRLIQQNGVRVNGETVSAMDKTLSPENAADAVIQAGKRKFLRIVVT
ncbi:MAG TPA: tyrosine--tRNA ligase [Caldilineaceae bacterium]|nr:tyrosine--tRNA ligase [Caldilineaceae bacterium]